MSEHARRPAIALALAPLLLLAACKDVGLPGRNTPIAEAMTAEWRYPLYQIADPLTDPFTAAVTLNGEPWLSTGTPMIVPPHLLRPVTTVMDRQIFAPALDEEPFAQLFHAVPGGRFRGMARAM